MGCWELVTQVILFFLSPDCPWTIFKLRQKMPWMKILRWPPDWPTRHSTPKNSLFLAENIKPYVCYEIRVHALSRDQGGCSSIQGNSKYKGEPCNLLPNLTSLFGFGGWQKSPMSFFPAPLRGPHINAITEEKGSILISWNHIPVQEQMGCILYYRIYWKERDSGSQPGLCGKCENHVLWGLLFGCGENTSLCMCVSTHKS